MKKEHQNHPAYQINFRRIFIKSTILALAIVAVVMCCAVLIGKLFFDL